MKVRNSTWGQMMCINELDCSTPLQVASTKHWGPQGFFSHQKLAELTSFIYSYSSTLPVCQLVAMEYSKAKACSPPANSAIFRLNQVYFGVCVLFSTVWKSRHNGKAALLFIKSQFWNNKMQKVKCSLRNKCVITASSGAPTTAGPIESSATPPPTIHPPTQVKWPR